MTDYTPLLHISMTRLVSPVKRANKHTRHTRAHSPAEEPRHRKTKKTMMNTQRERERERERGGCVYKGQGGGGSEGRREEGERY